MTDGAGPLFDLPARRRRMGMSLAPLIDVTFILLIFFMLVTQFERFAPVDVTLGDARDFPAVRTPGEPGAANRLRLDIGADGAIRLPGRPAIALDELAGVLPREVERVRGRRRGQPVIAIAPQPAVPLQLLLDVLGAVQQIPSVEAQIVVPGADREAPR
jgi:biopolymer transport protein ExbD